MKAYGFEGIIGLDIGQGLYNFKKLASIIPMYY
jgi:hypothetical protein